MQEQVAVIYAGTRGFLDNVAVNQVSAYEAQLLSELRSGGKGILDAEDASEFAARISAASAGSGWLF